MEISGRGQEILRRAASIVALLFVLSACSGGGGGGDGDSPVISPRGELFSLQMGGTITKQVVSSLLSTAGGALDPSIVPSYSLDYYTLTYRTVTPEGAETSASGLLLVPLKDGGSSPLLSMQHSTLSTQALAPSRFVVGDSDTYSADTLAGLVSASLGYIVAMPDYLGYGVSSGMFHPYVQAASLADVSVDMLRASRNALQQLGVATNDQLFLAGYSEGGYATLALQREIETALTAEFALTAAESGSGPYDLSGTTDTILQLPDLAGATAPAYLAFLLIAYDTYASSPSGLDTYFTPLALGCVDSYFSNGAYGVTADGSFDACVRSTVTSVILNDAFINAYNSNDESVASLQQDIALNDIYDWSPQVPTRLFYSPLDEVVPPENTEIAYTTMVANGAPSIESPVCTETTVPVHVSCALPFYNDVMLNFELYAQDL